MTGVSSEREVLETVLPLDLMLYLRLHGWEKFSEVPDKYQIWIQVEAKGDNEEDLLLPLNPDLADYPLRVAEAVKQLAASQKLTPREILGEIKSPSYDLMRVRVRRYGRIHTSLEEGYILIKSVRKLLLCAASAAITPREVRSNPLPPEAHDYVHRAEISTDGFNQLEIRSPVTPELEKSPADANRSTKEEEPFERRAMAMLISSLRIICNSAKQFAESGTTVPVNELIEYGVSAELCAALSAISEGTRAASVSFSVSWSANRPFKGREPSSLLITKEMTPIIQSLEARLRSTANNTFEQLHEEEKRILDRMKSKKSSGAGIEELMIEFGEIRKKSQEWLSKN